MKTTAILTMVIACAAMSCAGADEVKSYLEYCDVVARTAGMVSDENARQLAGQHGLNVLNVTWEDTGRYQGSCVGPNISDVTIQVQMMDPRNESFQLSCMPVIRYPNFSDLTADLSPNDFYLLVGNEKGGELEQVPLTEYLDNIRKYLTKPESWAGKEQSLLAPRDTHVLVSAQACFLPVPKGKKAEFNPVIFNYQSYQGDPAVLCILATREGTSATIIDNVRDGFAAGGTWGQRLFFNHKGERASLTGQRLSDFIKDEAGEKTSSDTPSVGANKEKGLNMVLLIQVPLKQKEPMRFSMLENCCEEDGGSGIEYQKSQSDVEEAVIGHGKVEGPYTEIDNLEIERDPKFPIRVTVQFYKATSNGVVSESDMAEIKAQIDRVYKNASYVGSLVVDGDKGRPTAYEGPKFEPPDWWDAFWRRHHKNTGQTRRDAITMLRKLYGTEWVRMARTEEKFTEALQLAKESAKK